MSDEISSSHFLIKLKQFLISLNDINICIISKCGKKFKITSEIIFFNRLQLSSMFKMTKLNSFYKQLNLYYFKKVRKGIYEGYYENKYFDIYKPDDYLLQYKRSDTFKKNQETKISTEYKTNKNSRKRKAISPEDNINVKYIYIKEPVHIPIHVAVPVDVPVYVPIPIPVPINDKHMSIMNNINFCDTQNDENKLYDNEYLFRLNLLEKISNPSEVNIEDYF